MNPKNLVLKFASDIDQVTTYPYLEKFHLHNGIASNKLNALPSEHPEINHDQEYVSYAKNSSHQTNEKISHQLPKIHNNLSFYRSGFLNYTLQAYDRTPNIT